MPSWKTLKEQIQSSRRHACLAIRQEILQATRSYFISNRYLETPTPMLVQNPGMEPHIRPMRVVPHSTQTPSHLTFLHTSPEFAMKKLLAAGLPKIFQLATVFRSEPISETHLPEFTLLEWYRQEASYEDLMEEVENFFFYVFGRVTSSQESFLLYGDTKINLTRPWPRLTINELFKKYADIDLGRCQSLETIQEKAQSLGLTIAQDTKFVHWDDYFFKIWLNRIEPNLPKDRPVFVKDYPPSQAALAVVEKDSDGLQWAKRFELFMGGLELANAFEELSDPIEQKARFEKDMALRTQSYSDFPTTPQDPVFLEALQDLPPCSGIALGIDRLVMLLANETDIRNCVWIPPTSMTCSFTFYKPVSN